MEDIPSLKGATQCPYIQSHIFHGVLCNRHLSSNVIPFVVAILVNYDPMRFLSLDWTKFLNLFLIHKDLPNFLSISLCRDRIFIFCNLLLNYILYLWLACCCCCSKCSRRALEANFIANWDIRPLLFELEASSNFSRWRGYGLAV